MSSQIIWLHLRLFSKPNINSKLSGLIEALQVLSNFSKLNIFLDLFFYIYSNKAEFSVEKANWDFSKNQEKVWVRKWTKKATLFLTAFVTVLLDLFSLRVA
jgi:hypothetical protein